MAASARIVQPPCVPGQEVHPWSAGGGNPKLEAVARQGTRRRLRMVWRQGELFLHPRLLHVAGQLHLHAGARPPTSQVLRRRRPSWPKIPPGGAPSVRSARVDAPANGKGGWIGGVEVSGAFEFGRLSRLLDGFGATGSVSYTDYKLKKEAATASAVDPARLLEMGLRRHRLLREERLPGAPVLSPSVGLQGRSRLAIHQPGLPIHRRRRSDGRDRLATPSSPARVSTVSALCCRSATSSIRPIATYYNATGEAQTLNCTRNTDDRGCSVRVITSRSA